MEIKSFSSREILDLIIRVEENGSRFYGRLADKTQSREYQSIFRYFQEQEHQHKIIFEEMLAEIDNGNVFDFGAGEYDRYFSSVAEGIVFTEEKLKQEEFMTDIPAALELAVRIEKESIELYSKLRDLTRPERHPLWERIIREEEKHLEQFTRLKRDIAKRGE